MATRQAGAPGRLGKASSRRKQVRKYAESKMAIVYSPGAALWAVGHTGLSSKERLGFEVLTSVYRKYFNQRHWMEASRAQRHWMEASRAVVLKLGAEGRGLVAGHVQRHFGMS